MKTFEESTGKKSATRIIFVIGSFWNMLMVTLLAFFASNDISVMELIAFYSAIQGVLIGLKLGQKPMEKNNEK